MAIGRFLETLSDEQLQRVTDAEYWCAFFFVHPAFGACLVSHVFGADKVARRERNGEAGSYCSTTAEFEGFASPKHRVWSRYDDLNRRFHDFKKPHPFAVSAHPTAVRMIQDRARRILATRAIAAMPTHTHPIADTTRVA